MQNYVFMHMVSVDIVHPPMDLENISDLDLEADTPLDDEAVPCPEADHCPALSDLYADQPHCQDFQTSHTPAHTSHPPIQTSDPPTHTSHFLAQTSHPPAQTSHPPAQTSHPPARL